MWEDSMTLVSCGMTPTSCEMTVWHPCPVGWQYDTHVLWDDSMTLVSCGMTVGHLTRVLWDDSRTSMSFEMTVGHPNIWDFVVVNYPIPTSDITSRSIIYKIIHFFTALKTPVKVTSVHHSYTYLRVAVIYHYIQSHPSFSDLRWCETKACAWMGSALLESSMPAVWALDNQWPLVYYHFDHYRSSCSVMLLVLFRQYTHKLQLAELFTFVQVLLPTCCADICAVPPQCLPVTLQGRTSSATTPVAVGSVHVHLEDTAPRQCLCQSHRCPTFAPFFASLFLFQMKLGQTRHSYLQESIRKTNFISYINCLTATADIVSWMPMSLCICCVELTHNFEHLDVN